MSRQDKGVTNVFGLYFCNSCKNMLTPTKANGHILEFSCVICGPQQIDFSARQNEECMLYSKELQVGISFTMQGPRSTCPISTTSSTPPCLVSM